MTAATAATVAAATSVIGGAATPAGPETASNQPQQNKPTKQDRDGKVGGSGRSVEPGGASAAAASVQIPTEHETGSLSPREREALRRLNNSLQKLDPEERARRIEQYRRARQARQGQKVSEH